MIPSRATATEAAAAAAATEATATAPEIIDLTKEKETASPPTTKQPQLHPTAATSTIPGSDTDQKTRVMSNPYQRRHKKRNNPTCVPGLAVQHFVKSSTQFCTAAPTLVSSFLKPDTGAFIFVWNAMSSSRSNNSNNSSGNTATNYALSIQGTAYDEASWQVHCPCPAFAKRGDDRVASTQQLRVCKHLFAALQTVVDPEQARSSSSSSSIPPSFSNSGESTARDTDDADNNIPAKHNPRQTKKRRLDQKASARVCESPIKLFATVTDLQKRSTAAVPRTDPCYTQCYTLSEMIFGHGGTSTTLSSPPTTAATPAWIVISNFLVDLYYLVQEVPLLQHIPRIVLFHGGNQPLTWPSSTSSANKSHPQRVDIQRLDPNADPHTSTNPCRYRFPFGSHHTKLFLVGYTDKIRVVVSTGNLQPMDALKANAAYVEEFPRKVAAELHTTTSDFEDTLVHYMESYRYRTKAFWMGRTLHGGEEETEETLTQVLRRYDYSQARGVLIPSIPGYHNIVESSAFTSGKAAADASSQEAQPQQQLMGQLKLRQAIHENTTAASQPRPVVCQFTSIGTTNVAYLQTLQSSMDMCLAASSLHASNSGNPRKSPAVQLQLVFPTSTEIRNSVEGYRGGGTVPGSKKNVGKPHLRNLWYKYTSSGGSNPLAQPRIVPHIKSYYQVSDDDLACAFEWLCITSHNISQPAWGVIRNNKKYAGQHLYIASWELGVFIAPQTLGVDRLVLYGTNAGNTTTGGTVATVPMPYDTHNLEKYSGSDAPWAWDEVYAVPDAFGQYSLHG